MQETENPTLNGLILKKRDSEKESERKEKKDFTTSKTIQDGTVFKCRKESHFHGSHNVAPQLGKGRTDM